MSYLEKARRVAALRQGSEVLRTAKEANEAKEAARTVQTFPVEPRNKGVNLAAEGYKRPDTFARLPGQLERLLGAATSDLLPKDPVMLSDGLVMNLNHYTLAWGCSYMTGDSAEALRRLWQAHRIWQVPSSKN